MGKFDDAVAELGDLASLTSEPVEDVKPEDVVQWEDGDGDALTVGYAVRDMCDGSPLVAGFAFHTPPGGVLLDLEDTEALAEHLVTYIDKAKEAGLQ